MTEFQHRTITRTIEPPSADDAAHLKEMMRLYGQMLSKFLEALQSRELRIEVIYGWRLRNRLYDALLLGDKAFAAHIAFLKSQDRTVEARLLEYMRKCSLSEKPNLQKRHWKIALEEAILIMKSHWARLCKAVRRSLDQCMMPPDKANAEERHYYNWLLQFDKLQFFRLINGDIPNPTYEGLLEMGMDKREARAACSFDKAPARMISLALHARSRLNKIKSKSVRAPRLTPPKNRMDFDMKCWGLKKRNGRQEVSLMSLIPYYRVYVALQGLTSFRGTVRLLENEGVYRFSVYKELPCEEKRTEGDVIGIDLGYTEVLTTSRGERFGDGLGKLITKNTDKRVQKEKRRNRFAAQVRIKRKKGTKKDLKKARNIEKHNLGRKKLRKNNHRAKTRVRSLVNQALNELFKGNIKQIVVEKLAKIMRACFGKTANRRLGSWIRGYIRQRILFKAKLHGIDVVEINPAFTSVTCPDCGFFSKANRKGDKFLCRICGSAGAADRIAAHNILQRKDDEEITLRTTKFEVRRILTQRFLKRVAWSPPLGEPFSAQTSPDLILLPYYGSKAYPQESG
jgi:IS605 OrfB family transposase